MGKIFYIADPHFGHKGMLKQRPGFQTVQEMNQALLTAWTAHVRPQDDVYILGDLFCYREDLELLRRLPGRLRLICGNHEASWLHHIDAARYFEAVWPDAAQIVDNGRVVRMCHYPRPALCPEGPDGYFLYGHLHGSPPRSEEYRRACLHPRALNVGADVSYFAAGEYRPATLDEWISFNRVWRAQAPQQTV